MADDGWRRWIAENLMTGEPTDRIIATMKSKGFSDDEAVRELKAAEDCPYVQGAELVRDRLKKRDWLLGVYRKNHRLRREYGEIERQHRLSRLQLLRDYYSTNRPVVITGMMDDWPAMRKWNLDYFAQTFGDRQVEVRMPRISDANDREIAHEPNVSRMQFGDFIEKMRTAGEAGDFHLEAHHASGNRKALSALWDDVVPVPEYLASDRPGGALSMAPRGAITPFQHHLTSSLMAQVIGRSRVKLAPSWDMPMMQNNFHWFTEINGKDVPSNERPLQEEPQIFELVLRPGEVLFLPVGCLLFVESIEISVMMTFANFVFDNDFASSYATYGRV